MIVLDTQHVSQLQRAGSADAARLESILADPTRDVRITIITPQEQLQAVLARIHAARTPSETVVRFRLLHALLDHYAWHWTRKVLPFDERAALVLEGFEPRLRRRIGTRDARIAAIALANGATLATANLGDFRQVPGLSVENWL